MAQFPQTPSFTGFNTPSRIEADIVDLVYQGTIPRELNGAFFRVQPDPQFPPRLGDDISFNGDGMITRFHIHDGQCDFRQRWARTDKWKLERAAGRALFGAYRNPLTDEESVAGRVRGTANTNAWIHGGRLYALKEDSPALLMNAATLETEGYTSFDGRMTGQTFTAHPKVDRRTGNMIAFGYAASGLCTDDCTFYEVTPRGELVRELWFKAPYYCMMHDFAITEDYALFHIVPSIGSWERLRKGLPHFGFDTTLPVYLGVLPRGDGASAKDIRWFKRDNCFASHVLNAFQDGRKIHFDTPEAKNNMFPFFPDVHGAPFNHVEAMSHLTRWTVDMTADSTAFTSIERLTDTAAEFPRIDERFAGVAVSARLAARDGHAPPGGAARRQRGRLADELSVPQGSRDRRGAALVVRTGLEPAGAVFHSAAQERAGGRRLDRAGLQPPGGAPQRSAVVQRARDRQRTHSDHPDSGSHALRPAWQLGGRGGHRARRVARRRLNPPGPRVPPGSPLRPGARAR